MHQPGGGGGGGGFIQQGIKVLTVINLRILSKEKNKREKQ